MNIASMLYESAERTPEAIALVAGSERISYANLLQKSMGIASFLIQEGLQPGDHVALMFHRSTHYIISYWAAMICGAVVTPIGPELTPREIATDLIYCDVSMLITSEGLVSKAFEAVFRPDLPMLRTIVTWDTTKLDVKHFGGVGKSHSMYSNGTRFLDYAVKDGNDLALLLHTSGTTSSPKRVMLSHANLISNVRSHAASLGLKAEDTVLINLPMHFGYCNTAQFLTHTFLGGRIVLSPVQFNPVSFFQLVQEENITTFTAVPTMLLMMVKYKSPQEYDISSLRYCCFGGGPIPKDKLSELIETFPSIGFVHTYGQTEASPRVTALLPVDSKRKLSSVGKPIPNVQVSVLDEADQPVGACTVGHIVVNGPNVMLGYYKRPEETAKVLRSKGLFTGDIGYVDEEGYLFVVGRVKNIIISGGVNIYPEEVEECLRQHPAVREVVVTGQPDNMLGEIPIARIVTTSDPITEREVINYCSKRLTAHKVPKQVIFVDDLPKTYNSKLKRD